jgi:DNA primase
MSNNVEQIKNKLGIIDVVGSYLKLEKAGVNFKSRCPFHNEKTPSFFISPQRESFYCFGCGRKGDIFNFVQEFEGVDFLGSLKILADRAGVKIERIDPKLVDEKEKVLNLLEYSTSFYESKLKENKEAIQYLKKRGLDDKIIENFRIGFAPDSWRELLEELRSKSYSEYQINEAGMSKISDKDRSKVYDRFRSRIMFPVSDPSGRIIAFSGRIFPEDKEGAKYLNSPETKLFKKSFTLYGYDRAKLDIRRSDFAILVEGNVDVLMAHQAGYRNTVAPLGTALTKEQIERLSKLTKKLVIAFDSDSAGFNASSRGAKIALSQGIDLKVALIPEGSDPADLILKNPDAWKKAIRESKHIVEFYLEKLERTIDDKRKLGLKIREEILPFVLMIENKIDQAHFVKILAEKMDISQDAVLKELGKIDLGDLDVPYLNDDKKTNIPKEGESKDTIIEGIKRIILWQESLDKPSIDIKSIKDKLVNITGNKELVKSITSDEKSDAIFEAEVHYQDSVDIKSILDELFLRAEINILKEGFNNKMRELKKAEKENNAELSSKILQECQNLSKQIESLKEEIYKKS